MLNLNDKKTYIQVDFLKLYKMCISKGIELDKSIKTPVHYDDNDSNIYKPSLDLLKRILEVDFQKYCNINTFPNSDIIMLEMKYDYIMLLSKIKTNLDRLSSSDNLICKNISLMYNELISSLHYILQVLPFHCLIEVELKNNMRNFYEAVEECEKFKIKLDNLFEEIEKVSSLFKTLKEEEYPDDDEEETVVNEEQKEVEKKVSYSSQELFDEALKNLG